MPASSTTRRPALGHLAKRWLYLVHRWIGIAGCLFFAMWFVSGLVMIYVPYPSLTNGERLAHLRPIAWGAVIALIPQAADVRSIALEMRDGQPIWRVVSWSSENRILSAAVGRSPMPVNDAYVRRIAAAFGGAPAIAIERLVRDQWTVAQRFDRDRPLWKAALADGQGAELYVSSTTGDIVQVTTRRQRFWNWLGSVPHWIYPTILRRDGAAWRQVVLWVSGPCIAAAVTGMWIGILRTRPGRRRFKGGRVTPYRGWMLWHHAAGLLGGVFLCGWIFSGWLSVDPGRLFQSEGVSEAAERAYQGPLVLPADAFRAIPGGAVRVEAISSIAGPLLLVSQPDGSRTVLDARSQRPIIIPLTALVAASRRLLPGARVINVRRLSVPDTYWYDALGLPVLPVIRIRFDDSAATSVYLDPGTGALLGFDDHRRRAYRWLFDLLHKWDLNALTRHRPLWDGVLWILSLLGLITSVSGIWIGWRRLKRQ